MNDTHQAITSQLSDYLDGELSPRERAVVDRHLAECADCQTALDDLQTVVGTAKTLPGRLPERDLWEGVEARIQSRPAPVIAFGAPVRRRVTFTLPQLAAAAVALMMMSGGLVYMTQRRDAAERPTAWTNERAQLTVSPVSLADPHYELAIGDLERTLAEGRTRLDPETVRVLERNLETIDRAIAQSREALEADPGNIFLNSHLVSARQRKLALLRRATALTTGS